MDELIDHCVRELSFDGDLGCSVSRLREFVVQYFASHHAMRQQVVDDSYFAFVWSVLVQQPMVRVGTVPPGVATEVYIAPQTKAKAAKLEADQPAPATSLDLVEDAQTKSLEELQTLYGDALRIAVDPTTSFVAITGSHTRPSKMSGMVYTALQLISRGRERGLSVVDLGKKTGYDQKSCFYLVKQLLELNLVVKLRQGGVGTNFCVHRHFYETGAIWTEIREHEAREQAEAEAVEEGAPGVQFDPIDKNHLISLPFVKARLVKLLKQCANHIHPVNGLIKAMGFANPTKEDRRFFQGRLKELTEQGVIERILVPNVNKRSAKAEIPCIRLIAEHGVEQTPTVEGAGAVAGPSTAMEGVSGKAPGALKVGVMLHRQIIDLLVEAGTKGLVLNEISSALDNFDKRTIELLLNRLEANPPPPHLSDLGVAQLMETYGRERRYRYYTVASYRTIVEREKLDDSDSKYAKADFSNVGGFAPIDADVFYENDEELIAAVEGMAGNVGPAKKIGRPRKSEVRGKEPARPRGRPRKRKLEEEAGGDVSIVEAEATGEGPSAKKRRTAKKAEAPSTTDVAMAEEGAQEGAQGAVEIAEPPPPKRKRGRPPKKKPVPAREPPEYEELVSAIGESSAQAAEGATTAEQGAAVGESSTVRPATPAPRKRGRPRKNPLPTTPAPPAGNEKAGEYSSAPVPSSAPPKRGRGRPRKHPLPPPVSSPAPEQQPDPPTTVTADQAAEPAREGDATADITTTITSLLIHPNVSEVSQPQGTEDEEQLSVTTDTPRRSQRKSKAVVREEYATPVKSMKGKEKAVEMPPPSAPSPQPESMDVDQVDPSVTNETGSSSQVAEPEMSTSEHPQLEAAAGPSEDIAMGTEGGVAADQQPTSQQADIPIDPALVLEDFTTTPQIQQPDSVDASLEHAQATDEAQHKRTASESADPAQPSKRQKLEDPGKVRSRGNVSLLRRENEFLRVLEELGGITYSSAAEFIDAHLALLESMAAAGEATSGLPGLKVDKRTVTSTLDDMEERGKIKTFQTAIRLPTGPQKQVRIMYLPTIAKEQLDTYVAELGRGLPTPQQPVVKRVEEEIKYGRELAEPHRRTLPLDLLQRAKLADYQGNPIHPEAVDELFQREDQDIRDTLLTERSIVSQLHGFISGKALRARELHLYTLRSFEEQPNSFHIVSAEERIVNLSFYSNDIPLAVFCALVSTLTHDEQLIQLLLSEEGRRMLVKNLPLDLYSVLSVGRTRTRSRLLDLFELLQGIGLVTPLQRTESATPFLRCTPKNEHPSAFDVFTETWSPQSSINSPAYWRFNAEAPIHLWSISEDSPAFWKNMSIRTSEEATAYWEDLCKVCLDREFAASITCPPTGMRPQGSIEATARSIRRKSSWKSSYDLNPIQQHYLNRFFNQSTGQTPLQDQDGGATTLERIAWVISAPLTAVTEWFRESHARYMHRIERAERKPQPKKAAKAEKAARRAAEEQQLVEKAANARAQREQDWQSLVQRLHPDPMDDMTAARIGRIRNLFMDSGTRADNKKWEREISRALQDAKTAEETRLVTSQKKVATIVRPSSRLGALSKAAPPSKGIVPSARGPPPPVAASAPGKSVAELIADQGPVRHQKKAKKRSKKAKEEPVDEGSPIPTVRRHRFQWNREYDELARDACVIVRVRCRGGRKDWSALAQVFPGLVPNSVRQHFNQLTVGSETYLKRLEDRWYELWVQHRGSEALPDANPESLSDFDLAAHVEFLRRHIDKNALRVGFVGPQEMQNNLLPSSLAQIESSFDVIEKLPNAPTWDFMWSLNVDEGREKGMLQQAFVRGENDVPVTFDNATDYVRTAEAALKMVFGTPNENYDASAAAELLHDIGEQPVSVAQGNLLTRGVLSKLVRDLTKPKPGRTLKISEVNQNALGGAIASDTFQDAATLETLCEEQEDVWREWPLLSTDGDTAALLQAVSDGKVDFTVDISQPRAARALLDWNSKKADDDHIETAISVKFHDITALPEQPGLELSPVQRESAPGDHGKTTDGNAACCRESSDGIIDCEACLTTERASLTTRLNENDQRLGDLILARLQEAGFEGLTKMALMEYLPGYTYDEIWTVVGKSLDSSVPLIHFTGYSSLVMVSASHIQPWTVVVSSEPLTRVLPRRWLDIRGSKMADVWEAALHAVIGVIIFRPGIRQSEIRWRLRAVYDRQEVIEMLQSLLEEGFIKRRLAPGLREPPSALIPLDDEEEKQTFWVLGDRHWYQA